MSRTSMAGFAAIAVVLSLGVAACGNTPEPAPAPPSESVIAPAPAADTPAPPPAATTPESPVAAPGGEKKERGEKAEAAEHAEGRERSGGEHAEGRERSGGEHAEGRDGAEGKGKDEGEEGGEMIARTATWDKVRRGARLVLSFDAGRDMFVGTVVNTTGRKMCAVRVEVHLKGGPELGPTPKTDLAAGGTLKIELPATRAAVADWTAHPEVSPCGAL